MPPACWRARAFSEASLLDQPALWTLVFGALATLLAVSGPLAFVRQMLRKWGIWLLPRPAPG
jgi:NCS1 family nucleobase:cation symporter-1